MARKTTSGRRFEILGRVLEGGGLVGVELGVLRHLVRQLPFAQTQQVRAFLEGVEGDFEQSRVAGTGRCLDGLGLDRHFLDGTVVLDGLLCLPNGDFPCVLLGFPPCRHGLAPDFVEPHELAADFLAGVPLGQLDEQRFGVGFVGNDLLAGDETDLVFNLYIRAVFNQQPHDVKSVAFFNL